MAREKELGELVLRQQALLAEQQALIESLTAKLHQQEVEAARLRSQVERLEKQIFGSKTERVKVPTPAQELRAADDNADEEAQARKRAQAADKRRENALKKNAAMHTEEVEHPVPDDMRQCPKCGEGEFHRMRDEISPLYEYLPGRFVRRLHKRHKMACTCGAHIVTAPLPPKLVARGQYGFGFIAFLVVEKCVDSIPIHRIEKRFARLGIPISRSTMNDLVHMAAELVRPLVARLAARVATLPVVLADETPMRIQDRKKRGFVWVFHGQDEATDGTLVLYVFAVDRSGTTPARILGGTHGALVVDGYTGYNKVTDPGGRTRAGCWSHVRRKFFEAMPTAPSEAVHAIELIRELFRVEHDATEAKVVASPAHLSMRHDRSKPILEKFFDWADETLPTALPKSPLGEALAYATHQRGTLMHFMSDANVPIHNNLSEGRLRVIALARHTYLFFGHPQAGKNFAGLYSLVGSCIANHVEPTAYLTDVLPRIRDATTDTALDALLPDRWTPLADPN